MKRNIYIIFFLLLNSFLFSKSIFIYIDDAVKTTSFIEEGILDRFFENGHIVFNAESKDGITGKSVILAKNGGADIIIEIVVIYPEKIEKEELLPLSIEFRVIDIINDSNVVGKGSVSIESVKINTNMTVRDICSEFGKNIAETIMKNGFTN